MLGIGFGAWGWRHGTWCVVNLPGGIKRWGPGACDPYFGGDNFVLPSKPMLTLVDRLLFVWLYLATVKRAGEVPRSAEHDCIECAGSEPVELLVRKLCPSTTASAH